MSNFYGSPSNTPLQCFAVDGETPISAGGIVEVFSAKHALNIGDAVYMGHDLRATKGLGNSFYQRQPLGIVIGGLSTNRHGILDSAAIATAACAAIDEPVLVMRKGYCYAIADATGILKNAPISAGQTTAGRVLGNMLVSYARTSAGLVIKAGSSALVKAANVTQTTVVGLHGTATAANLDQAALSGTVVNATHNVFEFRVAGDGTTVTSAMGTAGATRDAIVFPTPSAILAVLGWVFINPTGTGNFVGGTTALDDATVVPNAVYVNAVGKGLPLGYAIQDGGAAGTAVLVYVNC